MSDSVPDVDTAQAIRLFREAADLLEQDATGTLTPDQRLDRAAVFYELIRPEHRSSYLTLPGFLRRRVERDVQAFFEHAGEHGYDSPWYATVAARLRVTRGSVQNMRDPYRPAPNRRSRPADDG